MPNLISPGLVTAQVVFQGTSNLPNDRYVNTFHFTRSVLSSGAMTEAEEDEIATRLVAFYNTDYPTFAIANYLSVLIHREADTSQIRIYDMGESEPREPHIHTWTLAAAEGGGRQPQEAALCMSFYSERNIPRQRGRVYLGPFESIATAAATARPDPVLRQVGVNAMEALVASNDIMRWCTLHHTSLVAQQIPVTAGWCDDEWDTQRRRGLKSTSRIVFGP